MKPKKKLGSQSFMGENKVKKSVQPPKNTYTPIFTSNIAKENKEEQKNLRGWSPGP